MPNALTILPKDPDFPDYLDFEVLRLEGRGHIAQLSGEIWTDHNVHDPGITIMEVLVYALIDLGYRLRLPIGELLSLDKEAGQEEDNFFTAAQILSCNPLTINDYRKLLLDEVGVRNAWLEIADQGEVPLAVDCANSRLRYLSPDGPNGNMPLELNGLYHVLLELENKLPEGETRESIVEKVKNLLHSHRNLCEDFVQVKVLDDEEIAVCAEIELVPNAEPDDAMVKILEIIDGFLSPSIKFYTLQELLEKKKTTDQIFEGRPLKLQDSHGFIDTEELEALKRIREIHVSDLYREILKLPEVRAINKLLLRSYVNGKQQSGTEAWCLRLQNGRRPVLAAERADFTFFKGVLPFRPDLRAVVNRYKKRLGNVRKAKLEPYSLDLPVPLGRYREDLEDYRSIQLDFPNVYGIGEEGLAQGASDARKAQALQLKGYLLFYDQLLANYLSQLSHVRDLFSVTPENGRPPEKKRTYFAQRLEGIPKIETLIRFYSDQEEDSQEVIAELWLGDDKPLPDTPHKRNILIKDSIRAFQNGQVSFSFFEQGQEFRFIAIDQFNQPFLKGRKLYPTLQEAENETLALRFIAVQDEAYKRFDHAEEQQYTFEIINNPLNYWPYLNRILEGEEAYVQRRDSFLNHLLSRFAEHFTDYVLLMYALNGAEYDLKRTIQDKSYFLQHYPEISRNRGQGYNYRDLEGIWNTENISGFERRVTAMMGIPDARRKSISNFQVVEQNEVFHYRVILEGITVWASRYGYPASGEARDAAERILALAKSPKNYKRIDCNAEGVYTFKIVASPDNEAIHPGTYPSAILRRRAIRKLADAMQSNLYPPTTNPPATDPPTTNPPGDGAQTFTEIFAKTPPCQPLTGAPAYHFRAIDEDDIYAYHPETFPPPHPNPEYQARRTLLLSRLAALDEQYSLICTGKGVSTAGSHSRYRYQLTDKKTGQALWLSYAVYPSVEAAFQAFQNEFYGLIELARDRENYKVSTGQEQTAIYLAGPEGNYLAFVPESEMEGFQDEEVIRFRQEHALRFPLFKEMELFRFRLVSLDGSLNPTEDWLSSQTFAGPFEALKEFFNFLELLSNKNNWLKTQDEENLFWGIAVGEVLLEGSQVYNSEFDAWEGTKSFLRHFQERQPLVSYIDYWDNCRCTFKAVSSDYWLATHPHVYQAQGEREVVLSCLRQNAAKRDSFFELVAPMIAPMPGTDPGSYTCHYFFITSESGERLWRSFHGYGSEEEALEAYEENHIAIMNLARVADNYKIREMEGADKVAVLLCDEDGNAVAILPQDFRASAIKRRLAEIVKRIRQARLFPIIETALGYQFDIYDLNFNRRYILKNVEKVLCGDLVDNYCVPESPDSQPGPHPKECGPKEEKYLVRNINRLLGGGVILKGVQAYGSRKEIYCVIDWLKENIRLFHRMDSYQPGQAGPCGPYSIDWVNPAGIIAGHPRSYLSSSDCQEALNRAISKVNSEGVHIVEHILLRPFERPDDRFILKIPDKKGRDLLYSATDYSTEEEAQASKAAFASQVKSAAGKIYSKIVSMTEGAQLPAGEWQPVLELEDSSGNPLAKGCQAPLDYADFIAKVSYLRRLQAASIAAIPAEDRQCGGTLPEICIEEEDCCEKKEAEVVEKCGVPVVNEEEFFDCYLSGADPYSFWVTVILPYWPQRFQNSNFKSFFESTIRRELPAYVAARIFWINPRDMKDFEKAYRDWLLAKSKIANLPAEAPAVLAPEGLCVDPEWVESIEPDPYLQELKDELNRSQKALMNILFEMKNDYPFAQLLDCGESGTGAIVQLDQSKVG